MERLKALPGATGNSLADRKGRDPEKTAAMTLEEHERWIVLGVAQRYHHSEHRGLPLARRPIQRDGLSIHYLRYWHPIFAAWSQSRRKVWVRYHPEDLSRVFVSVDGRKYHEARYADLRLPAVCLWEQRRIVDRAPRNPAGSA